jgi:hypothetical protein
MASTMNGLHASSPGGPRRRAPRRPLLLTLSALLLAAVACARHVRTARGYLLVAHGSLVEAAATYRDAKCDALSGRPDPEHCGPFACDGEKCGITPCTIDKDCFHGACADGYCLPYAPSGDRVCEPFVDLTAADKPAVDEISERGHAYLASRNGCACAPNDYGSDWKACSTFPCLPDGCYVKRCTSDEECRPRGLLCSHAASGPHFYCVRSDPH